ncbi:MAG: DUF839 domain-containing protein [Ectothiorhodospiraceae bacterium]|jgi:secreted PhoX family phosphatase
MTHGDFLTRRRLSALALAAILPFALAACGGDDGQDGATGAAGEDGAPGVAGTTVPGLTRLATAPLGAEFTGVFVDAQGNLFFNAQHPADSNTTTDADGKVFNLGTIGGVTGLSFDELPSSFAGVDVPVTNAEKEVMRVAIGRYQVIAQEGETFGGAVPFGLGGIVAADGASEVKQSNDPDFNAFVRNGANDGYLFTNWEDRPGGMSRLHLTKGADGRWSVSGNEAMMLDFSNVNGTWVNCFGTLSPWGNPLSSEELYFDDTADWNNPDYDYHGDQQALQTYLGGTYPNPYDYGYIVEITAPTTDTPKPVKNYVFGRFSHEDAVVMPDHRTVYLSDDGTGTVFFKFVATQAIDTFTTRSDVEGTLYAAQVTQDSGVSDPASAGFDINWVALGTSTNGTLANAIREFDGIDETDYVAGENSYITDAQICAYAESQSGSDLDCDADSTAGSNPYGDDRIAFLESRKVAAALGASAEFRKMEGVNINAVRAEEAETGTDVNEDGEIVSQAYAYMAMSNTNKTMEDDSGDIQLSGRASDCGAVYRMPLEAGYDITRMEPVLVGGPYNGTRAENTCNVNNISEPDNVVVLEDGRVIVGEDTGNHVNNMLWVFDPDA